MRYMFISWLVLSLTSACDLNHNWKTELVETEKTIPVFCWGILVQNAVGKKWQKAMVLDVEDLHRKKGFLRETENQLAERTEEEAKVFAASLMKTESSTDLLFYSEEKYGFSPQELYSAENLQKLAEKAGVDYFLKIKLRNYGTMFRRQIDLYPRNKGVFNEEKQYTVDFAYAVLNAQGLYVDFLDYKGSLVESWVYRIDEDGSRTNISSVSYDTQKNDILSVQNFLGLEKIGEFGTSLVSFLEF